jgi:hypothetical protein
LGHFTMIFAFHGLFNIEVIAKGFYGC